MNKYFSQQKAIIIDHLASFLDKEKIKYGPINRWGNDSIDRLKEYTSRGKIIRGGLSVLGYEITGKKPDLNIYMIACAIELLQSAFLVHDDIMDNDNYRRGLETIHFQYQNFRSGDNKLPADFGKSMGICVGDISYFLSFQALTCFECDQNIKTKLINKYIKETTCVGLAQMEDVYFSTLHAVDNKVTEKDVLELYRHKTARYTFSLPLSLGAIYGGCEQNLIENLENFGEKLGLVFQIKDDELDIFGDEKTTGKPVGTDIKEKKKTLYYVYLITNENKIISGKAAEIFSKENITTEDINTIKNLILTGKIKEKIDTLMKNLVFQAEELLKNINTDHETKNNLRFFLDYSINRNF